MLQNKPLIELAAFLLALSTQRAEESSVLCFSKTRDTVFNFPGTEGFRASIVKQLTCALLNSSTTQEKKVL